MVSCSFLFYSQCIHSYLKHLAFLFPKREQEHLHTEKQTKTNSICRALTRFKSKRQRKKKQRKVLPWRPRKQMLIRVRHTDRYHSALIWASYRQSSQSNRILQAQRMCTEEHPVLLKHGFEFCDRNRDRKTLYFYSTVSL